MMMSCYCDVLFFNGLGFYIYRAGSLCGELVATMIAARHPSTGQWRDAQG
jgi:hypothetical protein